MDIQDGVRSGPSVDIITLLGVGSDKEKWDKCNANLIVEETVQCL